ncbi:TNF receptor-associated factor 5-like isoform X2 [Hydra vulgaris]|uniref:TNF receptor-associated factor 5-like isoform X2 n=1 Tax=Hydra vulgaris TaxID=6087 RepID=A0ABM4CE95_HYDVU
MQLKVKCSNFSSGCEWTGELKILNEHLGSCEYRTLKCLNNPCSTSLLPKNLKEHMENLCIYRLVTCQYCKQKIVFSEKQIHEENCECLPLCCVNQCGMKIMRKEGMRKEHETHSNSSIQNHLSMAIAKLDALENKITLTVDTLENKIASKVNALENKIMSKVESLETKIVSKAVALENKITLKVESFENKNASEVVALENKITSTVDALKNELISKVDAQKDEIMLHEKNLEIIKAFLAVKTEHFVPFHLFHDLPDWTPHLCHDAEICFNALYLADEKDAEEEDAEEEDAEEEDAEEEDAEEEDAEEEDADNASMTRTEILEQYRRCKPITDEEMLEVFPNLHIHFGSLFTFFKKMQNKIIDS